MCYRGCIYENYDGECIKGKYQLCPDDYETEEEYEKAAQELQDSYEAAMEQKYDELRDRRFELDSRFP